MIRTNLDLVPSSTCSAIMQKNIRLCRNKSGFWTHLVLWVLELRNYRNNAISSRENKNVSTGNNSRTLSLYSFFDGLNVSEVPQTKASVCLLLRQGPSSGIQKQRSITPTKSRSSQLTARSFSSPSSLLFLSSCSGVVADKGNFVIAFLF